MSTRHLLRLVDIVVHRPERCQRERLPAREARRGSRGDRGQPERKQRKLAGTTIFSLRTTSHHNAKSPPQTTTIHNERTNGRTNERTDGTTDGRTKSGQAKSFLRAPFIKRTFPKPREQLTRKKGPRFRRGLTQNPVTNLLEVSKNDPEKTRLPRGLGEISLPQRGPGVVQKDISHFRQSAGKRRASGVPVSKALSNLIKE